MPPSIIVERVTHRVCTRSGLISGYALIFRDEFMPLWMIVVRHRYMPGVGMSVYQFVKVLECDEYTYNEVYAREVAPLMNPELGLTPMVLYFDRQPPLPWEVKNEKMPMMEKQHDE